MSKRIPGLKTETQESIDFARWLRRRGLAFCHVPNEGKRGRVEAVTLKRMGVSAGVPDFLIFAPPPIFTLGWVRPTTPRLPTTSRTIDGDGFFIRACAVGVEMKRSRGGRLSDAQKAWLSTLEARGWVAFSAAGCAEAVARMKALGF